MEINLDYSRLWVPTTWAGWRYTVKNPKSFVIGVYGFRRFIQDRDEIMALRADKEKLERQIAVKNGRLKTLGKELSELKRNKE